MSAPDEDALADKLLSDPKLTSTGKLVKFAAVEDAILV